jgi:hypothetical protein
MEITAGLTTRGAVVATDIPCPHFNQTDLQSIATCVEAAMAFVTFTAREIDCLLALDEASWRSIAGASDE